MSCIKMAYNNMLNPMPESRSLCSWLWGGAG
jgi:hypothetical protein